MESVAPLAAALDESRHGAEALRQLYSEELERAARMALDLGRAQAQLEGAGALHGLLGRTWSGRKVHALTRHLVHAHSPAGTSHSLRYHYRLTA